MKIKFVQLKSDEFLTDIDFIAMSPAERGVYCTLIFYLNCNNGKCKFEPPSLSKLCGCESCEEFEEIWRSISKKFQIRRGLIKHKRVTKELTRAKKFIQHQQRAGLASARKRQLRLNHGSTPAEPTKRKGNVNERERKDSSNTNTKEQSFSSSSPVRAGPYKDSQIRELTFNEALAGLIRPRTQSDRTCFRNVTNWLMAGCARGRFTKEIFDRVLDYAKEASRGRNPAAVFMALLKKELGYRPGE